MLAASFAHARAPSHRLSPARLARCRQIAAYNGFDNETELLELNPQITDPQLIYPGDTVRFPCKGRTGRARLARSALRAPAFPARLTRACPPPVDVLRTLCCPHPSSPGGDADKGDSIYDLLEHRADLFTLWTALAKAGMLDGLNGGHACTACGDSVKLCCRAAHCCATDSVASPPPAPASPARPCADGNLDATLFAPTDDAFAALLKQLDLSAAALLNDTSLLQDVLSYHVIPGESLEASDFRDGTHSYSTLLKGKKLKVRRGGGGRTPRLPSTAGGGRTCNRRPQLTRAPCRCARLPSGQEVQRQGLGADHRRPQRAREGG